MTAQYWSRKLDGGYVWHGNKYKRVDGLRVDIPDDVRPRFTYPEDYLPHIKFNVGGEKLRYEDFETRFPIEEYKKIDGKAVWCEQTLARQWRVVPNDDSYEIGGAAGDAYELEQWLNAEPFQYDMPDRALHWGEDAIFSPTLMARDSDRTRRNIYLCNRQIMTVTRTADSVTMRSIRDDVPDIFNLWGPIGERIPYVWPEEDGEPAEPPAALKFEWIEVVDRQPMNNFEYRIRDDTLCIRFSGISLTFPHKAEIRRCIGLGGMWENEQAYEDVCALFDQHFPRLAEDDVREVAREAPAPAGIPGLPQFVAVDADEFDEDEDEDGWED